MARELIPARSVLVQKPQDGRGIPAPIENDTYAALSRKPNPYYSGTTMRMAAAMSYLVDGNVDRLKVRPTGGRVVQRWYLPHYCVEPIAGADATFVEYYRYAAGGYGAGGTVIDYAPEDIEHLRFGLDPRNPRKGMSPIRGVLREVYTDEHELPGSRNAHDSRLEPCVGAELCECRRGSEEFHSRRRRDDVVRTTREERFGAVECRVRIHNARRPEPLVRQ